MAKFYAVLTKIMFLLGIIGIVVCIGNGIIGVPIGLLAFLVLFLICFPGLVVGDLQKQIDGLRKANFNMRYQSETKKAFNEQNPLQNENKLVEEQKVWVCPKCGETNPLGTMLCRKCDG